MYLMAIDEKKYSPTSTRERLLWEERMEEEYHHPQQRGDGTTSQPHFKASFSNLALQRLSQLGIIKER